MAQLEALVTSIVGLSGSIDDLTQLQTTLHNSDSVLQGHREHLSAALAHLDFSQCSLGVLYFLHAQTRGDFLDQNAQELLTFISSTARFLQVAASVQIRIAPPHLLCHLCRKFKEHVVSSGAYVMGVAPLLSAIRLLQPNSEYLTPMHADFLQLCLLAKTYNAAAELLQEDIFDVDPSKTGLTPTDLYLYSYYGGMICIGRRQLARALELFLLAITAPCLVGNAIILAAYRKYVLVSLIHTGSVPPLPKFTSHKVRSLIESDCRPYTDFASAYSQQHRTGSAATASAATASASAAVTAAGAEPRPDKLHRLAEQHAAVWTSDNNVGLIKQVLGSVTRRAIQRLTQTYLTLSLPDIAAIAGLSSAAEAEGYILRMVAVGEIYAKVDQRDGMVRFLEDPEQYDTPAVAARIDGHIRASIRLSERLQAVNDSISLDKQYLNKVTRKETGRFVEAADFGSAGETLYVP